MDYKKLFRDVSIQCERAYRRGVQQGVSLAADDDADSMADATSYYRYHVDISKPYGMPERQPDGRIVASHNAVNFGTTLQERHLEMELNEMHTPYLADFYRKHR